MEETAPSELLNELSEINATLEIQGESDEPNEDEVAPQYAGPRIDPYAFRIGGLIPMNGHQFRIREIGVNHMQLVLVGRREPKQETRKKLSPGKARRKDARAEQLAQARSRR